MNAALVAYTTSIVKVRSNRRRNLLLILMVTLSFFLTGYHYGQYDLEQAQRAINAAFDAAFPGGMPAGISKPRKPRLEPLEETKPMSRWEKIAKKTEC